MPNRPMPVVIMGENGQLIFAPPGVDPADYPPRIKHMLNAGGAVVRVAGAAIRGRPVAVPEEVAAERLAICKACEKYDMSKSRCKACGCYTLKTSLATEQCPLSPPKWTRWEPPHVDLDPA